MYGSCTERTLEAFHESYATGIEVGLRCPGNSTWVAQVPAGAIVGFLSTTYRNVLRLGGAVGCLEELFICPTNRRQGIARSLWESAVEELRSHGVRVVEVVTSLAHPGQRQFAKSIGLEWYASIHRVQI